MLQVQGVEHAWLFYLGELPTLKMWSVTPRLPRPGRAKKPELGAGVVWGTWEGPKRPCGRTGRGQRGYQAAQARVQGSNKRLVVGIPASRRSAGGT